MAWGRLVALAAVAAGCGESSGSSPDATAPAPDAAAPADGMTDASESIDAPAGIDASAVSCAVAAPVGTHLTLTSHDDPARTVNAFRLSRDGTTAVFVGDVETDNAFYLYAVRLDGGGLVRLSHAYGFSERVLQYEITGDSQHVVFIADPGSLGQWRLYRTPLTGGAISTLYDGPDQVSAFALSPNSERVMFLTRDFPNYPILRSMPITGGTVATLSHGTITNDYMFFSTTPDSTRVLFVEDDPPGVYHLYSIPIDGGVAVTLNPVGVSPFVLYDFTADSSEVIFVGTTGAGMRSYYSVPTAGGTAVPFFSEPARPGAPLYKLSRDRSFLVVVSDYEVADVLRLYMVPRGGGAPLRLSQNDTMDPRLDVGDLALSLDDTHVVFWGDLEWPDVSRVYSVPVGGGAVTRLSQNLSVTQGLDAGPATISPDGQTVVFLGDAEVTDVFRVYAAPIAGGSVRTLSTNLGTDTTRYANVSHVTRYDVIITSDAEIDDQVRLYRAPLEGGTTEVISLDPGTDPEHDVSMTDVTSDGCWVVYRGDLEVTNVAHLHARKIR